MIELLNSIVQAIGALISFLVSSLAGIVVFITNIPQYFNFLTSTVSVIPPFLVPFAALGIFLTVISMLIRREIV